MSDKTIGALDPASSVAGRALLEIEQDESSLRATVAQVRGGYLMSGHEPLVNGQDYVDVTFPTGQADAGWEPTSLVVVNTDDPSALRLSIATITNKTALGFRLLLSGAPDSGNYYLAWSILGPGPASTDATTYVFTGPSSGSVGDPSSNFTVSIPPDQTLPAPVTITPSDGGAGGTFTPTSATISNATPSADFTYTAASVGTKTISVTNDGGLTDPADISYVASVALHLLNALVSYWTLDETAGNNRSDSHGSNHLVESSPTVAAFPAALNNGAYSGGGPGAQYLKHASNSDLQVTGDFFFSIWVRVDDPTALRVFIGKNNAAFTSVDYILSHDPTTGFGFSAGGAGVSVGAPATAFSTHHIVAWYDSADGKLRMRIDDATTYASSGTATLTQGTDDFAILASGGGNLNWNGLADEAGLWKRKPTTADISALFALTPYGSFTA
jgi:hypothetical protein